ncbi:MAG: hypothetical protein R2838_23930 [Caldilineaceae bacterium]
MVNRSGQFLAPLKGSESGSVVAASSVCAKDIPRKGHAGAVVGGCQNRERLFCCRDRGSEVSVVLAATPNLPAHDLLASDCALGG